jgi:hypothetical protein
VNSIGHTFDGQIPRRGRVRISAGMPGTHLLPGLADTLSQVGAVACELEGVPYEFTSGVLAFTSPRGARVEVAVLIDYVSVKVNDVVVATDIAHPDQVEHERLRETLSTAFRVLNGLVAAVEMEKEDRRRVEEQLVQRALDSL